MLTTPTDSIPQKTGIIHPIVTNLPQEMQKFPQWVLWKGTWIEKRGKWNKVPHQPNGKLADPVDASTWSTFEEVAKAFETGNFDGFGFVLTEKDPFACVDIDKVNLDELPNYASEIINQSFTEMSVSGKGLHVWTKYRHNGETHKNKNTELDIEIYSKSRFIAVTGVTLNDKPLTSNKLIDDYIDAYFKRDEPKKERQTNQATKPVADDKTVIDRMMKSKKNGEKIKALFAGKWEPFFPSQSDADLSFCNYLAIHTKGNQEQMDRIFRASGLYREKWERDDYSTDTMEEAIDWALSLPPKEMKKEDFNITVQEHSSAIVPYPFYVNNGALWKTEFKMKQGAMEEVPKIICRHSPIVARSFSNIERSQLYYEIEWTDHGRVYNETVPAGCLATKKDLLKLADMSLGVNDLNAKDLIDYFDKYVTQNDIPRDHLVERLGHIKNGFVHPLASEGIKILPADIGEKQIIEAFEVAGTSESWIEEVYSKVQEHPKATLLLLASFTSVILNDLKLKPFIVDLSGVTSQGKTTALRVAGSVWGNEFLVSEWNLTKVAAERKAAFLNSFPLLLDDTRKADEKHLQAFVYNFSGGRSKGRGSVGGSQQEFTWNNLMLSTGEDSLNSYAERAGGVAARILPITGLPFEGEDYTFFNEIYTALDKNYGAIGLEFLEHWNDKKKVMLPVYQEYNDLFQKKAQGNDVVARIARYYAAIIFTGRLLNEFFQIDIDIKELSHLFDEINAENKSTDKPMQLLEAVLSDLDADRGSVFGKSLPSRDIKAVFKNKTLYLLPNYLKDFLKSEQNTIRNEWLRREITIGRSENGKTVDYQQIKHGGKKFRGVAIKPEIVEKLGFDFDEENQQYQGYQID